MADALCYEAFGIQGKWTSEVKGCGLRVLFENHDDAQYPLITRHGHALWTGNLGTMHNEHLGTPQPSCLRWKHGMTR